MVIILQGYRQMKLQQIITFVAVYQERSFTAAAEKIHATQSGLSMQIKELEARVGVTLFHRSPKGVIATAEGKRLFPHAVNLIRQVEILRQEMAAIGGEVMGSVRVGCLPTVSLAGSGRAITKFTVDYPYVNLQIIEGYSAVLTDMIARGQIDFAIVPQNPNVAADAVVLEHIARDKEVLLTSLGSPLDHLAKTRLVDVGPLKLILPTAGNARREKIDRYLSICGVKVSAIMEMDAMMATLSLIENSDWSAILPSILCYPDMDGSKRKIHPLVSPELTVDYMLIRPMAAELSLPARIFADCLAEEIRRMCNYWVSDSGENELD
ncbi:MAG: LysR family transcriptional regulator, partial [candidate division Zixibacteria bacterium]